MCDSSGSGVDAGARCRSADRRLRLIRPRVRRPAALGIGLGALFVVASAHSNDSAALAHSPAAWIIDEATQRPAPILGLDEFVPVPDDNPLTPGKVALGERLFFDRLLSVDSTRSCASCHSPARAFSDTVRNSRGALGRTATRNTPTLLNRAYGRGFFWDGRAASLEEAVLMPIENPNELALDLDSALARVRRRDGYRTLFSGAFPRESISVTTVARALASYVRSRRLGSLAIDRYEAGDTAALTAAEQRGRRLFLGRARCTLCHGGPTFTDEAFHNTGVSWGLGDVGRDRFTGDNLDRGRFKTPSLRDIDRTAPYMHDGSKLTLEDVVEFYDGGGQLNWNLDADIRPRHLSADEKRDLVQFLRSLSKR
jgi:cytochrome c peroxidase